MKKRFILLLTLPLLLVTSCGGTSNSSSSETQKNTEFDASMLSLLASGYSTSGIYTTGSLAIYGGHYSQYIETGCTDSVYEYKSWTQGNINEAPTKDKIEYDFRYEPALFYGMKCLSEAELGLNNQVNHYVVGYNGTAIRWANAGYSNIFGYFSPEHFIKTENEFEFSLDMNLLDADHAYSSLATQLTGMIGLKAASFTIKTDGEKPVSYELTCEDITSSYGPVEAHAKGEFTGFGSTVVEDLKPIEGSTDAEFDSKMTALKDSNNWELDITLSNKTYHVENYNGKAVTYAMFDKTGVQTGLYGYIQKEDTIVQGVTKINDTLYLDGVEISGYLSSIFPTLDISSVFFNKSEESTDTKLIYTLKEEYQYVAQSTDFGMLAGSDAGALTITFENDTVTILNKLPAVEEKFVYSNINGVSDFFSNYQKTCDDLTWSQLVSNQPGELEKLLNFLPQEALDQIPTIGGTYSYVELDASYNPTRPVFAIPLADFETGTTLVSEYGSKLETSNFVKTSEERISTGYKYLYEKDCQINGETKTIQAEIYLVFDIYSFSARLLVYPSMK